MGGLIHNNDILLSVSYVQHCIVMVTGTVHVDFWGELKIRSTTTAAEIHTRQRGIVGHKSDVLNTVVLRRREPMASERPSSTLKSNVSRRNGTRRETWRQGLDWGRLEMKFGRGKVSVFSQG